MNNLYGFIINGQVLGLEIFSWSESSLNGNPPFIFATSQPSGYGLLNSIISIDAVGFNANKDYIFVRDVIKEKVEEKGVEATIDEINDPNSVTPTKNDAYLVGNSPVGAFVGHKGEVAIYKGSGWEFKFKSFFGFDQLTTEEKLIACVHKIGNHTQRVATVGLDEVINMGLAYHSYSVEARQKRAAYAIAEVHNRLPNQANQILAELISQENNMILTYINFGIEGTNYDGAWDYPTNQPNGIIDYVLGTANFENSGLINKNFTPDGLTLNQLCLKLEEILIKGNL